MNDKLTPENRRKLEVTKNAAKLTKSPQGKILNDLMKKLPIDKESVEMGERAAKQGYDPDDTYKKGGKVRGAGKATRGTRPTRLI